MSHFTVLVVTDRPEQLEPTLQPFHEYECTGIEDQYVKFIDESEEIDQDWKEMTMTRYRTPGGELFDGYEKDIFYQDLTDEEQTEYDSKDFFEKNTLEYRSQDWDDNKGYYPKKRVIPESFEKVQLPISEIYPNKAVFAKDYHGYIEQDGKLGRFTNPNAKWDWYQVGGRWSGYFTDREGNQRDQGYKHEFDFEAKILAARKAAGERYDKFIKIMNGRSMRSWKDIRTEVAGDDYKVEGFQDNMEKARKIYHAQEPLVDLRDKADGFGVFFEADDYLVDREAYVDDCGNASNATYAVLLDGKWIQQGEMGWWGMASNEKEGPDWSAEFAKILKNIPDDKYLTVVDCHI